MAKTANSNYGGAWSSAGADGDAFDRTDVGGPAASLDTHDHSAGLGLAVARVVSGLVLTNPVLNGAVTGTAGFGAWTAFTPTLNQTASITCTTAAGWYTRLGKLMIATLDFVANSAGTGGAAIKVGGLAASFAHPSNNVMLGIGRYIVAAGPTYYTLSALLFDATTVQFYSNAASAAFGINPAVTVAAGDKLTLLLACETT